MKYPAWRPIETRFLECCYKEFGGAECAKILGRSTDAVQQKAQKLGYTTPYSPALPLATYRSVLVEECAKWFVPIEEVTSRSIRRIYTFPRFTTWQRLHDDMGYSLPQIGKRADRDHTVILSGIIRARAGLKLPAFKKMSPAGGVDIHMRTFERSQSQMGGE